MASPVSCCQREIQRRQKLHSPSKTRIGFGGGAATCLIWPIDDPGDLVITYPPAKWSNAPPKRFFTSRSISAWAGSQPVCANSLYLSTSTRVISRRECCHL